MNDISADTVRRLVTLSIGKGGALSPEAQADIAGFIGRIETLGLEEQREYFVLLRILFESLKPCAAEESAVFLGRIERILKPQERTLEELFPLFGRQKNVEMKKEFSLNFGGLTKIEEEHNAVLEETLTSGLTVQQHIDQVRAWFNSLQGEDLGNWLKLFGYVQAVKTFSQQNRSAPNFKTLGEGICCFGVKLNKEFFKHFIKPDKKSGQFTTKAKARFLKWLYENQRSIEFPMILNGNVWRMPIRIYEYAENVTAKELFFRVNTSFLESEFQDYVSLDLAEIDAIAELWEEAIQDKTEVKTYSLDGFRDVPLKFLLTLKTIFNREGNYWNGGFAGNVQRLSRERLDERLGGLTKRLERQLRSRNVVRTGRSSDKVKELKRLVLELTFSIGVKRKWLLSMPLYEDGVYTFNMNLGYFDRRRTIKRLRGR